jgi:hypothetical protein
MLVELLVDGALVIEPATVGVVEPPAVAEGFWSSCIYPKSPPRAFPHLSGGYPGHSSLHDSIEVVWPGATLEHQHDLPCTIAKANWPTHVSRHAPFDWKGVTTSSKLEPVFIEEQYRIEMPAAWIDAGSSVKKDRKIMKHIVNAMLVSSACRKNILQSKLSKFPTDPPLPPC